MANHPGPAPTTDDLLDSGVRIPTALAWVWGYAAMTALVAVSLGDAIANATSAILPGAATRFGTVAVLVVAAGVACESVLTSLARLARRP